MSGPLGILGFLLALLIGIAVLVLFIMLLIPATKGIFWLITNTFKAIGAFIAHIFRFIYGMIADTLRFIGAVLTALVFVPLVLLNVLIGRWSASKHFGAALQDEFRTAGACIYRVVIGHPARLLLLHSVTEGIEKRIPEALANAPGPDRPSKSKRAQFDGYTIVGSLQGGGSGARLYVANPTPEKLAAFERNGAGEIDQVVIKAFSVHDGSSLPQIVRESRSLEAARKLGLVLDHDLTPERFFYVMPYVPGESLTAVVHRLHGTSGPGGLEGRKLTDAIGYVADLVETLDRYHRGGLWHKDVKPDNIIVSSDGRAHLVDLGLVTPLRSAMTLTTHGTEYFRDPEMVRMALRGAKVHEIDGGKVDVYGAGAVLYSVIEDSFPAHGELSRITKRCPEALRWVIRRSMAAMNKRYATSAEMLADLRAIQHAADPFLLKPKDLPSMAGNGLGDSTNYAGYDDDHESWAQEPAAARVHAAANEPVAAGVGSAGPRAVHPGAPAAQAAPAGKPGGVKIRLMNWWSGDYAAMQPIPSHAARAGSPVPPRGARPAARHDNLPRPTDYFAARDAVPAIGQPARPGTRTAADIRASAMKRVKQRQTAAARRRSRHNKRFNTSPNAGVIAAVVLFLLVIGALAAFLLPSTLKVDIERGFNEGFSGAESTAAARSAPVPQTRILLLNDRRASATPEEAEWLRSAASALGSAGYPIVGLGTEPSELELIATARTRLDGSTPDDAHGWRSLRTWLDDAAADEHNLSAVLWIPTDSEEPWRIIQGDGFEGDIRSRFLQALIDATGHTAEPVVVTHGSR